MGSIVYKPPVGYGMYMFPTWALMLGWVVVLSSISCVPIYALYKFHITPGRTLLERLQRITRPEELPCLKELHEEAAVAATFTAVAAPALNWITSAEDAGADSGPGSGDGPDHAACAGPVGGGTGTAGTAKAVGGAGADAAAVKAGMGSGSGTGTGTGTATTSFIVVAVDAQGNTSAAPVGAIGGGGGGVNSAPPPYTNVHMRPESGPLVLGFGDHKQTTADHQMPHNRLQPDHQ